MNKLYKSAGVALPIFSLPDDYGIGTIGKGARAFIDFLSDSVFSYWSILPLVPTAFLDSPYQTYSSRAFNPYFIDFEDLLEKGLLQKRDLYHLDWGDDPHKVDYGKIYTNKEKALRIAFKRFNKGEGGPYQRGYVSFLRSNGFQDYACFTALKQECSNKAWSDFDEPFNEYSLSQFRSVKHRNKNDVIYNIWTQYIFLHQWEELVKYAHSKGVEIIGEMPMYVSYDSLDVYKHHRNFQLNSEGKMDYVAGYPKDVFHETGQVWGNPLYNFEYLKRNGYRFIKDRIKFCLECYDVVLLSSFRVIQEYYVLKKDSLDGTNGVWHKGPGEDFLSNLDVEKERLIAEDVGYQNESFTEMIEKHNIPDMRVREFAYPEGNTNFNHPDRDTYNCYSFSTTHDCIPLVGYFEELSEEEKEKAVFEINKSCKKFGLTPVNKDPKEMARAVLELNLASNCKVAIQSMNDILLHGKESRINTPSTRGNNWTYRILKEDLTPELAKGLLEQNLRFGRYRKD